jgi:hypothetical protein
MIRTARVSTIVTAAALLILAFTQFLRFSTWNFDDSYIVFRIAHNILAGHGWVYNVGESHNASTSVLNTVLIVVLAPLTGNIPLAAHIIGMIAIAGSGLVLFWIFRRSFGVAVAAVAAYVLVLHLSTNLTWGLETNLFIFLCLVFVLSEEHGFNSWPVLAALVLARPDGTVMAGLKWLAVFASAGSPQKVSRMDRLSIRGVLVLLAILTPWVVFSLVQFHQVFPATLSTKMWQGRSGFYGRGPVYWNGLFQHYYLAADVTHTVTLALAIAGSAFMLMRRSVWLYVIVFALIQQIVYVALNVPPYRWYLALPDTAADIAAFYAVGTIANAAWHRLGGVRRAMGERDRAVDLEPLPSAAALIVALAILLLAMNGYRVGHAERLRDRRDTVYTAIGERITREFPGDGDLALAEVGTVGYVTGRPILDFSGLTSARGQFMTPDQVDTFYNAPPMLVLLHNPPTPQESAIFTDARFDRFYAHAADFTPPWPMRLYQRKPGVDADHHDRPF